MAKRDEDVLKSLTDKFKDKIIDPKNPRDRRLFFKIAKEDNFEIVKFLKEKMGFVHCATITGCDSKTHFEIMYHLFDNQNTICTVKAQVPKEDPFLESITPLIAGANLYERELFDILGVTTKNHPNLKRLVLPEDYPVDAHPMLKDWDPSTIENVIK